MADDAEYQMELNEEAAAAERIAAQSAGSSSSRPLLVLADGQFDEIWDWSSPGRVPGLFAALHDSGVGLECFETADLPDEAPNAAFLDPYVVDRDGAFEVLIVEPHDVEAIRHHAIELRAAGRPLRDSFLADMFEAMGDHIEENAGVALYVFARTV